MFDTENLRPVVIGMVLYVIVLNVIPRVITKPTGIKLIDDLILFIMSSKESATSGAILMGMLMYLTNYVNAQVL